MKLIPLDPVGVEVTGINLETATEEQYRFIRNAFIEHQLVVIREQNSDWPIHYARLVERVSSRGITDLKYCTGNVNEFQINPWHSEPVQPSRWDTSIQFPVQRVTGERFNGEQPGLFPTGQLNWHSDRMSPMHVNGTALMAHKPVNSSTSFIHTPSVYKDLPDHIKDICERAVCYYKFDPNRLSPDTTERCKHMLMKSQIRQYNRVEFSFPLLIKNATKSVTGLYFNYNMHCRLTGTGTYEGDHQLFSLIKQRILQPQYKYRHWWKKGDIVLFSQDLTLHTREEITDEQLEQRLLFRYGFHTDPVV